MGAGNDKNVKTGRAEIDAIGKNDTTDRRAKRVKLVKMVK